MAVIDVAVILVATGDPADAARVRRALALLDREMQTDGARLPASLQCDVVHACTATSRQETTDRDVSEPAGDDACMGLLLTITEAADRLRSSPRTVQRFVASGALTVVRLGRRTYVRPTDLQQFVDSLPAHDRRSTTTTATEAA